MTASPKTTDAMLSPLNAPPDSPTELLLGSKDYATHRPKLLRTNNAANENIQPAAIALPKTADEVARVVRWATASGLRLVVRGAGNDFFSRSIADGALVIGMRHLNSIQHSGYGPSTKLCGMGFEQIVGAQLVNAKGEVVDAIEEMLEGFRGMLGHLGVMTSLTVKTYPRYDASSPGRRCRG
ncbi:hypothetical protein MGG_01392 [Pyricularia oryzae 70-15]|uniref:FAD linked oxidase N-terminal domain-containing protein n=1 Tax=Pyricularia oryzae (strain 70-15 / ATCC MYA-4617 / FGSC 8958) TaxID=242507 RepID=G4MZG9_PYRO7|nr:uncharacterized protein MGG_01392 [Pyricularia oryzae 70-15]EHA54528.1 hypothetical protein MGG_01392 [Pyricularia oryzae 70-15]